MKLINSLIVFFFLLFIALSVSALNIDPVYSHIRNFAIIYYDMSDEEAAWVGQHHDLIIGHYHPITKQYNPDIIFFKYAICQALPGGTELTPIWNACLQSSETDCENMFFHLIKDSSVSSQECTGCGWETRTIPGWNPANDRDGNGYVDDSEFATRPFPDASARYKNQSRIPGWLWSDPLANFNNTFWSDYCTDRETQSFAIPGYTDEYTGLMNDAIDLDIRYPVLELNQDPAIRRQQYITMTGTYLTKMCGKVRAKGKICSINSAAAKDLYAQYVDVELNEFWFTYAQELAWYQMNSTGGYDRPFTEDNYYVMKQVKRISQYNTTETIQFQGNDYSWWPGCSGDDESVPRDKYYFLSLFYQVKNENAMFSWYPASADAIYNRPPSTLWLPAIEVDIGQPEGDWYIISGTNPDYYDEYYEIFVRNYTKGRVYTKPRPSWNSCIGSATATTHNLGGVFRKVNYDGTISPQITSISLRDKEGAILLKDAYAPENAPHIDMIQCQTDGSWKDCNNSLYGTTISSVRAICNDNTGVNSVQFKLENIPDSRIFFSSPGTLVSGYWIYDNPDVLIQDSGNFKLTVNCTDIDGATVTNTTNWLVPWGNLSFTQETPTGNGFVTQNQLFTYRTTVYCNGGECGNIKATLDPIRTFDSGTGLNDTFIRGGNLDDDGDGIPDRNDNYGSFYALAFGQGTPDDYYPTKRPLIKFNNLIGQGEQQIPPRAVIKSATLYLYQAQGGRAGDVTVSIHALLKPWTEMGATFVRYDGVNSWEIIGAIGNTDRDSISDGKVTVFGTDSLKYYGFNVTRSLQMIANGQINNYGWVLISNSSTWSPPYFQSKENTYGSINPPYLVVDYDEYGYKGVIPMNSGTPFYTINQNPVNSSHLSCLGNMKSGNSCTTQWSVMPTGNIGTEWSFFVNYDSENYPFGVNSIATNIIYLNITTGGPSDTTPPTVSITSPSSGSTVSGTVTVSATASDNIGVAGVQFRVDGINIGSKDTTSPYSISWNTTSYTNGNHILTAMAQDTSNNTTTSAAVTVNVNNVVPCTPSWQCGDWTSCLTGSQSRMCNEVNQCDPNDLNRTETQNCGTCTSGQTQSCTTESCAGTQTCNAQGTWDSCMKQDLCCGVSCNDGSDCTTDSCSAGQCSFITIPNCSTGGGGGGGGSGTPTQKEFLVELNPSQVKIGEKFTVTVKDSSLKNAIEKASVEYAKTSKFTSVLGQVEFTAVQGYSLITVKKDGYKNNTVRITVTEEPVSLCGNNVCDLGESHGNCPADCPAGKKLRVSAEKASVISGDALKVIVTDEGGNAVGKAKVVYAGKSYESTESGEATFTAVKGFNVITASKAGFEPASTMITFITARSECGNNKCEEDENTDSCAMDCFKEKPFDLMPFTAIGVALILIVVFLVIIIKSKKSVAGNQ